MENNIELELRAEVSLSQFEELLVRLRDKNKLLSQTKRLSVMFLGKIDRESFDVRIRIASDGNTELVVKRGEHHAHDRVEVSENISKNQFLGIVKIFSLFGFQSKVTERENFVFDLGNNITISLVKAGLIAYVEIEKMSHKENVEENKTELLNIIDALGLNLIKNEVEFNELCRRLTRYSDWPFRNSEADLKKLKIILKSY